MPAAAGSEPVRISLEEAVAMALANQLNPGPLPPRLPGRSRLTEGGGQPLAGLGLEASTNQISPEPPEMAIAGIANPNYSTGLTLSWPLYTGGKVSTGIKMARLGLEAAQADYEKERER